MNSFYELSDLIYPLKENKVSTETHLYGGAWEAWIKSNEYYLEYISGEHAGRLKKIQISLQEFEDLKLGMTTCDAILIIHNAY
jgi:hypothetical protein